MTWAIIYISAVLVANYTAVWFLPLPVFGLVAIGTLIFGATFTARDYVHRLGRARVYLMIAISSVGKIPDRRHIFIALAKSRVMSCSLYLA